MPEAPEAWKMISAPFSTKVLAMVFAVVGSLNPPT